jgi:hypothetical protein
LRITAVAADADHPSFAAGTGPSRPNFGDAYFNVALRQAKGLKGAFVAGAPMVIMGAPTFPAVSVFRCYKCNCVAPCALASDGLAFDKIARGQDLFAKLLEK